MTDRDHEELFSDEQLDKAIKNVRRRSVLKTVLISIITAVLVFALGSYGNSALTLKMSNESFERQNNIIKLTVPNGYISKSVDYMGFLGGRGSYTISTNIGDRAVALAEKTAVFGIVPQLYITRYQGSGVQTAGEWPNNYWENGYRKMMFFHPGISYKAYKNDLNELDKVPDNKIIEMAVSFDKAYEFEDVSSVLQGAHLSWCWIDAFTKDDMNLQRKNAEVYDAKSAFLYEYEVLGVGTGIEHSLDSGIFDSRYGEFLELLKNTDSKKYKEIYDELVSKGYTDGYKIPILGAVVYGTKDELKGLIGNTHIKASSFGVIIDKY